MHHPVLRFVGARRWLLRSVYPVRPIRALVPESIAAVYPIRAPFVGVVEIVCGSLLLMGLVTRLATVPLLIDIAVAIYSSKIVTFAQNGFWGTLHEARTDVSMLLGLVFLLLVGAGAWSLDLWLAESEGFGASPPSGSLSGRPPTPLFPISCVLPPT
jgi:uncharacterized membrane protein YphA (DoxX/SURF4 family)